MEDRSHSGRGGGGGWGGQRDDRYQPHEYDQGAGRHGGGHYDDGRGQKRGRYEDYEQPRGGYDEYGVAPPPQQQQPQYQDAAYYGAPPAHAQPYAQPYAPPQHHQRPADQAPRERRNAPLKPDSPSASVVLLGLPPHVTDIALRHFLEDMGASIDSTTVIIDRATGLSKQYGFAKFSSVEHARAFVEPNFPTVSWKERVGVSPEDGMRIKINYSQKTGGWREDQGATARMTEDQRKAAEANSAPQSFYVNDGTRDIGSAPTQILLLRNLDPLTPEEEIVSALCGLSGRAGDEIRSKAGVRKVMMARDRASRGSWGFAFVQFADVRLATEVLASAFNPQQYPTGFRIRNQIIAFSFSHENSFIPIYARSEFSFRGEGGQQLAYWDDKAFVSIWESPAAQSKGKKVEKAPEDDMEAFFSSLDAELPAASESTPVVPAPAIVGGFAPIALKSSTAASLAEPPKAPRQIAQLGAPSTSSVPTGPGAAATAAAAAVAATPLQPEKTKGAERIISRKAAPNISKWNTKQAELKVPDAPKPPKIKKGPASTVNSIPVGGGSSTAASAPAPEVTASSSSASSQPPTASTSNLTATPATGASTSTLEEEFPHGDPVSMICLLCQRQFKKLDELRKHNRLSTLHKTNLADAKAVADCATRKATSVAKNTAASSAVASDVAEPTEQGPQYVDRAAARREAWNQPNQPAQQKKRKFDGPAPKEPEVNRATTAIEETNVGSKMLEKMGWSKGVGLGATASGRVDPITAAQFAQGAGLGATKGVKVGEFDQGTKGSWAETNRVRAAQRYQQAEGK